MSRTQWCRLAAVVTVVPGLLRGRAPHDQAPGLAAWCPGAAPSPIEPPVLRV
ncbi:hypothetical protein HEB29_003051 [Streptomyces fulvorobeus]|uniref:Uncharacterized protein n=1 Tax=Streptomyces fulvorobeus TaxID=284028 RepID=A0A7Y9KX10_9ACTN|nr:hypothetical protein [Streptomyces fulvorobeus]